MKTSKKDRRARYLQRLHDSAFRKYLETFEELKDVEHIREIVAPSRWKTMDKTKFLLDAALDDLVIQGAVIDGINRKMKNKKKEIRRLVSLLQKEKSDEGV